MFIDADHIRVYEGNSTIHDVLGEMLIVWHEFDYLWDWLRAVVHNRERMFVRLESVICGDDHCWYWSCHIG
jgi:hypothetical protein